MSSHYSQEISMKKNVNQCEPPSPLIAENVLESSVPDDSASTGKSQQERTDRK